MPSLVMYALQLGTLVSLSNSQLATWSQIYESPVIKDPKPGWARFCKGDEVYDTFANQCPVGIFWDEGNDNKWDCVCTRGPWRRSAGWCSDENTQRFTQGDITCFEPDGAESGGLQGLYYLGDRFSAWDSSLPILLSDYSSGIPIRKGDFSSEWEITSRSKMAPGVIIYRPRDDWSVENLMNSSLKLCLRAPSTFNEETEGLFIYNVSLFFDPSGGSQHLQLSFSRGCYSWNDQDTMTWYEITGESLEDKNMIVPKFNGRSAPEACSKCMSAQIPPAPDSDVDDGPLDEREEFTVYDLKNVAVLKTEIDLQTERLGQYWNYIMLKNANDSGTISSFQELEILTRAGIMAMSACDQSLIPPVFYQYFLILFRMLLGESFKKFAPKAPISDEYYERLGQLLEKCKERTKPIKFELSSTCPSLMEGYDGKQINMSASPDYTSDKGRHDFLLEFIWRLKSFLHYNCFEEFQMDSMLHDLVQAQLESLFTEDLILRWYNPGNSFNMYALMFDVHLDLDAAMKNFQRCVIVTKEISKYPVWLKRPIDRPEVIPREGSGGVEQRFKRDLKNEEEDEYADEDESKRVPNNLFGGKAACVKSIRTFMTESGKVADEKCW
ncbi:hypothetical protein Ocin01_03449 [Orchesella cincta]|uniref:Uncharacterized protein n=1 Tax=Orchesella cincta TaxID=48709 RepID=A0A1D2NDB2_ORCCI|nr:hypothetical protein Ocin01_03449 [Orchesella cincta]